MAPCKWKAAAVAIASGLLVPGVSVGGAGGAPPVTSCGQVITTDWTLHNDVGPCPGDGIVVGADNITLNLNGRRVTGTDGPGDGTAAGIRLPQRTGVTIVGGRPGATVSGFDAGVAVYGGSGNAIRHLTVRDNVGPGADLQPELSDGIVLFRSPNNHIAGNTVVGNGVYDGIAVLDNPSDGNVIERNLIEHTTRGGSTANFTGLGIVLNPIGLEFSEEPISDNRVLNNVVRNNQGAGISNISNIDGVISGNTVEGNGGITGIGVSRTPSAVRPVLVPARVLVEKNTVRDNAQDGIHIAHSGENRVVGNVVTGHAAGRGIFVFGDRAKHNVVSGNQSHDNSIGIWVHGFSWFNQILGNDAASNFDFDLFDLNAVDAGFEEDCQNNVWFGNTYSGEVFPPCTATGGTDLTPEGSTRTVAAGSGVKPADLGRSEEAPGAPHRRRRPIPPS